MSQWIGSAVSGANGVTKEYPVANGVTVTDGDFVYLTGGRVTNASIGGVALLGLVNGKQSNRFDDHSEALTTTGDSNGTKKVLVIVEPNAKFLVTKATDFVASDVGQRYDISGTTGAQVASGAAGSTGQLEIIQNGYKGNNKQAIAIIAEHRYKVSA